MKTNVMKMLNMIDQNDAVGKHLHQLAMILMRQEELVMEIRRQRFLSEKPRADLISQSEVAILSEPPAAEVAIRSEPPATETSIRSEPLATEIAIRSEPPATEIAIRLEPPATVAPSSDDGEVLQADRTEERMLQEKPDDPNVSGQRQKAETQLISTNDHIQRDDPNVLGQKRKAETPLISTNNDRIQPSDGKKEWSCALCRVTVRSERVFKQHLCGKKHKRREEDQLLRTRKERNVTHEQLPNKKRKLSSGSAGPKEHEWKVGRTLQCEKTDLNATISNFMKPYATNDKQHQFMLWCEKCKVGTYATNNMLDHLNGKRHKANHQE